MTRLFPSVEYTVYRAAYEGWHVPERTINNHELVMVTEGRGFVQIEDDIIRVVPHMLFYFYPNKPHSLWLGTPPFMKFYAVHFSPEKDGGIKKLPIEDVMLPGNYAVLENLFKELIRARSIKEYLNEWKQDMLLSQILYNIMKDRHQRLSPANVTRISAVLDYIHQNPAKSFTIEELCGVGQMQKSYLLSSFRTYTGYTPIQYVTLLKLEKSRDLLSEGTQPIKDIALTCGFSSEYYFSRLFRQHYGMPPRQFRNNSQ